MHASPRTRALASLPYLRSGLLPPPPDMTPEQLPPTAFRLVCYGSGDGFHTYRPLGCVCVTVPAWLDPYAIPVCGALPPYTTLRSTYSTRFTAGCR